MSDAPTAAPAPAHPDPDRAVSARLDSAGAGNLLRLLRPLFAYGRNLVETLRQNDDPQDLPWYPFLTIIFGTTNPALIIVFAIRGLLRLTALQHRLSGSLARARGSLLRLPLSDDRPAKRIDGGRRPGHGQPHAAGWVIPLGWPAGETSLDCKPTPEQQMFAEIVEQDRDRPIPAILLDICIDLGIVSALTDPATWDGLLRDLTLYGGDPATLIARSRHVQNSADPATLAAVAEAHAAAGPPAFTSLGDPILTSPPWLAPPDQPPPSQEEWSREADPWGREPDP
jgi:hypothetical protein